MLIAQLLQEGLPGDEDGSLAAFLAAYGTVERYVTSLDDTLLAAPMQPGVDAAGNGGGGTLAQRAHAAMQRRLLSQAAPQLVSGAQLLQRLNEVRLLPTGSSSIDDGVLHGGLRETTITEVSGETCSGKTQLCHLAAVTTAQRGERVLYVDTTNGFSASRAAQLLGQVNDEIPVEEALANITVLRCHCIHGLLSSLDELAAQAAASDPSSWPKLLIVDSISALLTPVIGGQQHNAGQVLVAETGRLLRHTAEALSMAVLLTNHVVGTSGFGSDAAGGAGGGGGARLGGPLGISTQYKPALGAQWRGVPHVRVQLAKGRGGAVLATLLTHSLWEPGHQAAIVIGDKVADVPVAAAAGG